MKLHVQRTSLALTGSLALLIGFAGLGAPSAFAATQNVACDGDTIEDATPSDSKKIEDALDALLASPDASKVLNISGNCSLIRTITLQSFPNVLIQGPANLSGGTATCGATPTPGTFPGPIFNIVNTRNITLRRFNISGGGGVILQDSSGSFSGVSIDGSRSEGLNVQGASTLGLQGAIFTGPGTFDSAPNIITNSCGNGINVGLGSSVSLSIEGTISGNGGAGVTVNGGSFTASACCAFDTPGSVVIENNRAGVIVGLGGGSASVNGGSTCSGSPGSAAIRNNREWGVIVSGPSFFGLSGVVTVENNQTAPISSTALAYRAGIYGNYGATVFVTPGAQIKTTNAGHGVLVDAQSKLRLGALPPSLPPGSPCVPPTFPNASITMNGGDGIRATHMSFVELLSLTSVINNGGKDAICDNSSILDGVKSGIGTNKC